MTSPVDTLLGITVSGVPLLRGDDIPNALPFPRKVQNKKKLIQIKQLRLNLTYPLSLKMSLYGGESIQSMD